MTVSACAKVNLTLEVYGIRPDGYHELRSVVQPVSLADEIMIESAVSGSIMSDAGYGDADLIVKAARCLDSAFPSREARGAHFRVMKKIPVGGGLGGGSADAAAVLRALNVFWDLGASPEALAGIGERVGSDVPALVLAQHYRQPVLMEGRGERVRLLSREEWPYPSGTWFVLMNPGVHSSTAEVYRHCRARMVSATEAVNDLEPFAVAIHPEIGEALALLREIGAGNVMMSGSGATVFGCAPDEPSAGQMAEELRKRGFFSRSVRTL